MIVTVDNLTNLDSEPVTLTETGDDTGIFRIVPSFPTGGAGSGVGVLEIDAEDDIETTYVNEHNDVGATVNLVGTTTGVLFGDTNKSAKVRSLDASLILQENVGLITFDAYQLLVGDVVPAGTGYPDPQSGDASEILKFVVGIVTSFPAQTGVPDPHPYKRLAQDRRVALGSVEADTTGLRVPIVVDEVSNLLSGNMSLRFDPTRYEVSQVTVTEQTSGFMVASNVVDGQLRIAFAGAQSEAEGTAPIPQRAAAAADGPDRCPTPAVRRDLLERTAMSVWKWSRTSRRSCSRRSSRCRRTGRTPSTPKRPCATRCRRPARSS